MGLGRCEQYTVGLAPEDTLLDRKFCISVGLLNVNVGFVFKVTKTLLELIVAVPIWDKGAEFPTGAVGAGVGVGVGLWLPVLELELLPELPVVGVLTGVGALQTEG